VIDVFPSDRRDQIQVQLASTLQGVISQRLLPAVGGGRVAAYEMLVATEAVRNLVREGKSRQLRNVMISAHTEGMLTLEMDLARLAASGIVSYEVATAASMFPKEVMTLAATQKAQQQAHATIQAGQSATMANAAAVNGN
jgi:twitching motility protein PilT